MSEIADWRAITGLLIIGVMFFSTSLEALIGISHADYLTVKSAPKTPSKI